MVSSFDTFDKIYCIHLPHEKEKREKIEAQFESVGVIDRVTFVHATPPPANFHMSNMQRGHAGEFGVNLSQIKAITHAISDGAQRPVFFEDDIEFVEDAEDRLRSVLREIPNDWDMLYLGGHPRGPLSSSRAEKYSENLVSIKRHSFADAYSMRRDSLLQFFDYWADHITKEKAMYDIILGNFAATQHSYAIYPLLCNQRPGISSISNEHDDKTELVARGWATHLGIKGVSIEHRIEANKWMARTGRRLQTK